MLELVAKYAGILDIVCLLVLGGLAYTMAKRKNRDEIGWGIAAAAAFFLFGMTAEQVVAPKLGLVEVGAQKALAFGVGILAGAIVNVVLLLKPPLDAPEKGKDKGAGGEPPKSGTRQPAEEDAESETAPAGEPADKPAGDKQEMAEPDPVPASELSPEALARRFWPVAIPLALFALSFVPALGNAVFGETPENPADDLRFLLLAPVIGVLFWRLDGRWLVGLVAAVFTFMYTPAIAWMQWRWGRGSSYYSHGYLIPLVVGWLIWLNRRRLARLKATSELSLLGLGILIFGLIMLMGGAFMRTYSIQGVSFVVTLCGGVLFLYGGPIAKALWFPLIFIVTMVPMPMHMVERITFKLKMFAAAASVWTVDALRALGIHSYLVIQDGSYIRWEATPSVMARLAAHVESQRAALAALVAQGTAAGSPAVETIERSIDAAQRILGSGMDEIIIGDVCSGLRSLIALIAFGALFAYLSKMSLLRRLILFGAAVPISVIANAWRIVTLTFIACTWGSEAAHGFVHDVTGYGIFAVAFVLFFSFERLLRAFGPPGEAGDALDTA